MAFTPTYTTAAIVKKRVSKLDTANLTDSDIEANINMAESIVDSVMQLTFRGASPNFTFDADKHGILRDAATSLAAWMSLTFDPEQFASSSSAALSSDLLWSEADRNLAILSDNRVPKFIGGL